MAEEAQGAANLNKPVGQSEVTDLLAEPLLKLAFGMSVTGLALLEIPDGTKIGHLENGAIRATYPDGSTREFFADDAGGGRMVTVLSDGSQIQSELSFVDGGISVATVSATGEKTVLTIDENGVNFQSISADGTISNEIPADLDALIEAWVSATQELTVASGDTEVVDEEIEDANFEENLEANQFFQPGNIRGQGALLWSLGRFANIVENSPEEQGITTDEFSIEEFAELEGEVESEPEPIS